MKEKGKGVSRCAKEGKKEERKSGRWTGRVGSVDRSDPSTVSVGDEGHH